MAEVDLKRALDGAIATLGEMHHASVAELQKAEEARGKGVCAFSAVAGRVHCEDFEVH
jgi:hypothetical protein